jgi:hypothetical protein
VFFLVVETVFGPRVLAWGWLGRAGHLKLNVQIGATWPHPKVQSRKVACEHSATALLRRAPTVLLGARQTVHMQDDGAAKIFEDEMWVVQISQNER